jgi:putative ABC transport system substrate-binding protein
MRRREFMTLVGGATAWPFSVRAQQPVRPVIGFLSSRGASDSTHVVAAFQQGLKEAGYIVDQNLTIEYRWAEGHYDRLPAMADDLVSRRMAVIAAFSTDAALAAKTATATLPIIFSVGGDPVRFGLVSKLNRPEGNVTGVSFLANTLAAKQFEIMHDAAPTATRIGFLVNSDNQNAEPDVNVVQAAADIQQLKLIVVKVRTNSELDDAFATLVAQHVGAVVIEADPFLNSRGDKLVKLAALHHLPAVYPLRDEAQAGGLMSYGTSLSEAYGLVGLYAGRILNGEKPADLPVQQSTKVELVINLKSAKALGLTFPLTLLGRADEVIE